MHRREGRKGSEHGVRQRSDTETIWPAPTTPSVLTPCATDEAIVAIDLVCRAEADGDWMEVDRKTKTSEGQAHRKRPAKAVLQDPGLQAFG